MSRTAHVERRTAETDIRLELELDGGEASIDTGVGFLDHMLAHVAKHGRLGLRVAARGDTHVDDHHTVEDVGLALGEALASACGDKAGIERYGSASVPMDEALARVAIDLSGRPRFVFHGGEALTGKIGAFDAELVRELFHAVASAARLTLHAELVSGENRHHMAEALFKGLGRALAQAKALTGDGGIPSTKGSL